MKIPSFSALVAALVTIMASGAQTPRASQLVKIGGISAENGEYAFLNNLITAYSDGDISVVHGAGEKWSVVQVENKSVSYEVKDLSLKRVSDKIPIAVAHEFQFCDAFDQVSRPVDASLRAILPKDAKVKAVEDYDDGRTLAVYSVPRPDHYRIVLSLIKNSSSKGYSVVGTAPVSEYGDYCGMQALTREVRAVLVDEPSGSSDFSSVYIFAVQSRKVPEK